MRKINFKQILVIIISSTFLAFGLRHIHSYTNITEGGVLGATLLCEHLFNISPAISGFILNVICYYLGYKNFGKKFMFNSIISMMTFSISYGIFEQMPPMWPELINHPLISSVLGALFIGIGAGFCVRNNAAQSGDDALAMSLAKIFKVDIQIMYLISDLVVLLASLSYIPFNKIIYSLLTVIISGQIIGFISTYKKN